MLTHHARRNISPQVVCFCLVGRVRQLLVDTNVPGLYSDKAHGGSVPGVLSVYDAPGLHSGKMRGDLVLGVLSVYSV